MLNYKYAAGLGAITIAAAAGTTTIALANIEEEKIHFQGIIFNSEDEVIDYMFSSEFLRVEKETVIGDLNNSYSNYDLGTLHKGMLPTYDPSDVSFAWRMANGMLTHDMEAAKETYFNEGISNILYSDGYGNDYLTQSDAILSAKRNITNNFNPYIELPLFTDKGEFSHSYQKYNPFNEADVKSLMANIDIDNIMEGLDSGNTYGGYQVYGGETIDTTINLDMSDTNDEYLWYTIDDDIQTFGTGESQVGSWDPTERIATSYEIIGTKGWYTEKTNGKITEEISANGWERFDDWNTITFHNTDNLVFHYGVRISQEFNFLHTSTIATDVLKSLINKPSDIFRLQINSDESGYGVKNLDFNHTSDRAPSLTFDNFSGSEQKDENRYVAIESIKNEIIRQYGNSSEIEEIFENYSDKIGIQITSSKISLELEGRNSENPKPGSNFIDVDYRDGWGHHFSVEKFIEPKIFQKPTNYSLDLSGLPIPIMNYLVGLTKGSNDPQMVLTYNDQKLFNINKMPYGSGTNYSITPIENDAWKDEMDRLNTGDSIADNLSWDYNDNFGMTSMDALNIYYKQARELGENIDNFTYQLDHDNILYLENYSYSNQLLTSIGRHNPSFSSSTTPTTFIESETDFEIQSSQFVPIPMAKYVFYDLNGKKIEYSPDAYDSFELMKRNIIRNIYVPKSEEYVYIGDGDVLIQVKNEQNSVYKVNIDGIDVYFAEHLKMRNYIKNILQNFVKYL